jgi:aspartate racemase
MSKTIGILGGMGPEATAYFYELIIRHTLAAKDQEHIPVIIHSDPRIPPRSDAILGDGESPVPLLRRGAKTLEKAGADLIVMPCITAHYFIHEVASSVKVPVVDLIQEAVSFAAQRFPGLRRAGLIATSGTVASRIIDQAFKKRSISVIVPGAEEQEQVMEAVFGEQGIKAASIGDFSREVLRRGAGALISRGAEAIIAGCTEIPLALGEKDLGAPFIEPMEIGALACIRKAGYRVRGEADG